MLKSLLMASALTMAASGPAIAAPQTDVTVPARATIGTGPGSGVDAGIRYYCNSNGSGDCYMNLGDCSEASGEYGCFFYEGIIRAVDLNNDSPQTMATFPLIAEWIKWLMAARRQAPFSGVGDLASRLCQTNGVNFGTTQFVINGRLFNGPATKGSGFQCEKGSGSFNLNGRAIIYRDSIRNISVRK